MPAQADQPSPHAAGLALQRWNWVLDPECPSRDQTAKVAASSCAVIGHKRRVPERHRQHVAQRLAACSRFT